MSVNASTCACMGKAPDCICGGRCRCLCTCKKVIMINTTEELLKAINNLPDIDYHDFTRRMNDSLNPRLGVVRVSDKSHTT